METEMKIELTDLQLRNLAEHIPPEKASELGLSLGLTKTDLAGIIRTDDPIGNTFRILVCWRTNLDPALIRWRNKVEGRQTEMVKLKTALKEHNLDTFIPCIDAHVTIEENELEASSPIVNLALPNPSCEAEKRQEIDILASFESVDAAAVRTLQSRIYHLITHPADSDATWSRLRRLNSLFQPHARLTNIMLMPVNFTVDVLSLGDLKSLKKCIDSGQMATNLLPVITSQRGEEGAVQADLGGVILRLKIDEESLSNGMKFFKDLDPTSSLNGSSQDGIPSPSDLANGFNAWATPRPKTEVDLPDTQERGVKLVWRNVSQQSFGF